MLHNIFITIKKFISHYIQVLFVWFFFALMVLSSYYFMSEIETKHLKRHVEDLLDKSQAYLDSEMNKIEAILSSDDNMFDITAIDSIINNITPYILSIGEADSGYGVLFDGHKNIIVHPNENDIGKGLDEMNIGIDLIHDLDKGLVISERETINYKNETVIVFSKQLNNGWYIAILIPKNNYYKSLYSIAGILIFLGIVFAGILSIFLIKIIHDKHKAHKVIANERLEFKKTAHWYKSILDAIPLPVSVTDANTCWTFINSRAEDFLGVKFEKIEGFPCCNWGAQICNTPSCGIECAKRGIKQTFFTHKNESYKVDIEILKDINGETAGYIEVVQDITQLEEMARRQMEAESVSKAKSAFIATMSHEIRTPLNAILGITDIEIQDDMLSQKTKEALIKIHSSGDLLLHIINDILDLSKIEAGKLELTPNIYDVPSLINDTVHLNMVRINNKPIEFALNLNENIPSRLLGDEVRIKQILNNVLSNAFKYTSSGNVKLYVDSSYNQKQSDNKNYVLTFKISDTGEGMTEEQVTDMFNEYSRFNMEANRTTEGTGLGMSITKHLIRLMNGEIFVNSKLGEGTTFTINLPQKRIDEETISKQMMENLQSFHYDSSPLLKKSQMVRDPMPYGSVLVVDDVETNLYVAKGLMTPYDLKIDLVVSGYDAIDKIKEGYIYDIIFMDHMMPKMDGVEATKIIRSLGYTNAIVALTANAVVGQADFFMKSGFDDFISKPIDVRHLNIILNKLIRDKQPMELVERARRTKRERLEAIGVQQEEIHADLANIFIRDAKKAITSLETVIKNNFSGREDESTYIINVHAIKSALANIGERDISVKAEKLEKAGRDGNLNVLLNETPEFINLLLSVIQKLTPESYTNNAAGSENDTETEDALAFLHEKLLIIMEACTTYDKKTIKTVLSELKERTWTNKTKEMLDQFSEYLLHSEYEKISAVISEVTKNSFN
ncbi:MAG: ATP-binding protein [Treponema sp.]|nr:ATP-binding protein [Treponema sp.]